MCRHDSEGLTPHDSCSWKSMWCLWLKIRPIVPVAFVSFNTSPSPLACFPQLLVSLVACFSVRLSAHEQFHLRRASIGSRISWHIYIPVTAMAHDCIYCVHTTTTTTPVGIPCQYLVYFVVFFFFFAEELYYCPVSFPIQTKWQRGFRHCTLSAP